MGKKIGESNINEGDAKLIEVANGYILTGYKYKVGSSSLYGYVQKIDKAGNTIWQKNFEPNIFFNYFLGITSLQDGGYLLCGGTWEGVGCTDNQCSRARLVKVDSTGKTVWDKRYFPGYSETGIAFNGFYDCQELTDGNIILVGSTSETQYNNDAGFLMKVTPKGDSLWCRIYDKNAWSGIDYWSGVTICRDGGFLCTGVALDTTGSSEGEWPIYKAWLVKTDSLGCWISGCSTDTPNEEIRTIEASVKIFPNPATDRLTIEVTLPHYEERTELVLCDITGKELMKTTLPDYAYIGYIDVSPLAAGMYILQLRQRGGVLKSEKVVVER